MTKYINRKTLNVGLIAVSFVLLVFALILLNMDCGRLEVKSPIIYQSGTITGYEAIFGNGGDDQYKFSMFNFVVFSMVIVSFVLLTLRILFRFVFKKPRIAKYLGISFIIVGLITGVLVILMPAFAVKTINFEKQLEYVKTLNASVKETMLIGCAASGITIIIASICETLNLFFVKDQNKTEE